MFPGHPVSRKNTARKKPVEPAGWESEVEDLRKYESDAEPDDYPRRMLVNVVAFVFIVMLTLAGIWIVEQLALLRKNQDCVFFNLKNCSDINAQSRNR
jgi:hypothetical protein